MTAEPTFDQPSTVTVGPAAIGGQPDYVIDYDDIVVDIR